MKKFQFSLGTVLMYKEQVLDALRGEHAAILASVRNQEELVDRMWDDFRSYNQEYKSRQRDGLSIAEAIIYQNGLHAMERDINRETKTLEEYRAQEASKREEVVEAKIETSSIEKLKEKKLNLYRKAVQKSEEAFIDEFVSAARVGRLAEG